MLRVPVTWWVVLLLPLAEVPKGKRCIGGHLGTVLFIIHDKKLHNCQSDGVMNGRVSIQTRRHRHDGQQVRFEPSSMKLCHRLVCHNHDLQIARSRHKATGSVVSWRIGRQ